MKILLHIALSCFNYLFFCKLYTHTNITFNDSKMLNFMFRTPHFSPYHRSLAQQKSEDAIVGKFMRKLLIGEMLTILWCELSSLNCVYAKNSLSFLLIEFTNQHVRSWIFTCILVTSDIQINLLFDFWWIHHVTFSNIYEKIRDFTTAYV